MSAVNGNGRDESSILRTSLIINGESRQSSDGSTFEVRNSFNKLVGISASATSQDCQEAIDVASKAFVTWEHVPLSQRQDIFLKAAQLVKNEKYKNIIIEATKLETTSKEEWGHFNWVYSDGHLKTIMSLGAELKGEYYDSVTGGQVIVQRRAKGVVFAIAPWNAPFALTLRAVTLPLLCGNTVVLKPSEYSPRVQATVVELFQEAGLPNGVLNYIPMSRESSPKLCEEIIANPKVRMINFTGSDRVGRILASHAGKHLKPCVFELGGKSPLVILNDANVKDAARAVIYGAMAHSGQVCMSTERVIVQSGIYETLKQEVLSICQHLKADRSNPDGGNSLSPLFTEGAAENVLEMLKEAKEQGAEVLLGDLGRDGPLVQPHLLAGVKPGMRIWERETFGPVTIFAVFDTIEEGIELANASDYTLSAALFTNNVHDAMKVASKISAGYVNVNGSTFHSEPRLTVSGLGGSSGYGRFDIDHFTDKRTIVLHPSEKRYPLFNNLEGGI